MNIEFTPSFTDQFLAGLTIQTKSKTLLLLNLIFPIAGVFMIVIFFIDNRLPEIYEIVIVASALLFLPIVLAVSIFFARKNKTVTCRQQYSIKKNGLKISGLNFDINLNWSAIVKIIETKLFFFFFFSKNTAYFIPKRVLAFNEIERIQEILKRECNLHQIQYLT